MQLWSDRSWHTGKLLLRTAIGRRLNPVCQDASGNCMDGRTGVEKGPATRSGGVALARFRTGEAEALNENNMYNRLRALG